MFDRGVAFRAAKGDDTLMGGGLGSSIHGFTSFESHGDLTFAAKFYDFLEARPSCSFHDQDAVKGTPGPERFPDGMDSCYNGH